MWETANDCFSTNTYHYGYKIKWHSMALNSVKESIMDKQHPYQDYTNARLHITNLFTASS